MGDISTTISPQDLIARIGTRDCPVIFDVRRAEVYAEAGDVVPTAEWRSPEAAKAWARDLPRDHEIVVYCVHGHHVSQGVAAILRAAGLHVRYLEGGIEGYRAVGGPTRRKDPVNDPNPSAPHEGQPGRERGLRGGGNGA